MSLQALDGWLAITTTPHQLVVERPHRAIRFVHFTQARQGFAVIIGVVLWDIASAHRVVSAHNVGMQRGDCEFV